MIDPIDRNEAIRRFDHMRELTADQVVDMLKRVPSCRPKGEWNDIGGVIRWGCSLCHYAYDQKFNFCPNCGADMRGEETDES